MKIAIDGPSGVGKSTLAKEIAMKFDLLYLDTGAMYRTVAYYFLKYNLDYSLENKDELEEINIDLISGAGRDIKIFLNGEDVSQFIREKKVAEVASVLAKYKSVRDKMDLLQKKMAREKKNIIMDGRDIGSNIMPDADLKFYLDADIIVRTKRRMKDLNLDLEDKIAFDEIYKKISERDYNDLNRKFNPLKRVAEAIFIDTSNMTFAQVKQKVFDIIECKLKNG